MQEIIVYDIINENYKISIVMLLLLIIPSILLVIKLYISLKKRKYKEIFIYIVFSITWICLLGAIIVINYINFTVVKETRIKNQCKIVEGVVKNIGFTTGRLYRQKFRVKNITFEISENSNNGGYNKTVLKGGALTDGVCVKIYYTDNSDENIIARLELLDPNKCK